MLAQLSSPPTYVSQEEHDALTSSTPESFTDIPPILRFLDEEVEVVLSPATGWWEGKVKGKLWVTEDAVAFQPVNGVTGFSLPFPSLTLHALTPASPDTPGHIYCQVDESGSGQNEGPSFPIHQSGINGMNGDADEYDDDEEGMQGDDDYTPMREIRIFLPEAKLQSLFSALSQCSALHDSLLPNGEPSSFFGFGDMAEGPDDEDDDEGWEDDMDQTEGDSGVDGGRVNKEKAEAKSGTAELESDDPVERFLNMVDWGHVQKPAGWDGGDNGEFDDAEEEGEGEGIPEDLLQRVQQLQMQ